MSGRVVRASKFRHVFGTAAKKEQCFIGTKLTISAWDSNFVAANTKYLAMAWQSAGGGVFAVLPHDKPGKLGDIPLVQVHKAAVLDLDWHPFNESLIASASEDCNVAITGIPEGGLTTSITSPLQVLSGHRRKVGTVNFHPSANNVLATSSADFTVKLWDIEKGEEMFSTGGHTDLISTVCWNGDGSQLVTGCRDKKLRIIDPRGQTILGETICHQGVKGLRALWMPNKDKIVSVGFSKNTEREMAIWDPRNLATELYRKTLDANSGVVMPFYDNENSILFLGGKGDGNIRYYEMVDEEPYCYYLSEYMSSTPQRGLCVLPKRAVNVAACETTRFFKIQKDMVEPISFSVPRKSDLFQDDLYPNCFSGNPSMTADEYRAGKNAAPDNTFDHQKGFVASEKKTEEFKPVVKKEEVLSEADLKELCEKLKARVAFLETEIVKKDAQIKEFESKQ
eukprot:TRINITY_DN27_c0_g1_i1.p1 TRINITY_DN27_c0_g1~~TRINITY_DN27_c0_g1_i1.p1  ORF type:complete len:452 (+),score=116.56 TRINITY_DN27_c0_g1_i1:25-1380(+)